jgi:hypothetical protein
LTSVAIREKTSSWSSVGEQGAAQLDQDLPQLDLRGELCGGAFEPLVLARVLNGDRRLLGQGLHQRDLVGLEVALDARSRSAPACRSARRRRPEAPRGGSFRPTLHQARLSGCRVGVGDRFFDGHAPSRIAAGPVSRQADAIDWAYRLRCALLK